MTGLKGLLRKKERIGNHKHDAASSLNSGPATPEVTFLRSTTDLEEEIHPPDYPDEAVQNPSSNNSRASEVDDEHELAFRTSANAEYTKDPTARQASNASSAAPRIDGPERTAVRGSRLSRLLHRDRSSRSQSDAASMNLPQDLGESPPVPSVLITDAAEGDALLVQEARWEKRATILASSSNALLQGDGGSQRSLHSSMHSRSPSPSISDARSDVNIQEAIRLHEAGDLENSTSMFGRLADPRGANNALAQVLYGLALRHGWGITVDSQAGVHYLSLAAGNAASVEEQALAAGATKGGAAKGELVLAIFELANCLRNGWGVKKDAVAARQYYEAAANLGDTDAMEQSAQCYLDGFGGPKDKFKAAQYLRLAEKKGGRTVGNSWIWKDKYNPTPTGHQP